FETPSKPGYGPEIGRKGLGEIARAARVPVLAIGGLNATRAAEVLAVGPAGIAVMGGVMRAADPGREGRALLAVVAGPRDRPRPREGATPWRGSQTPAGSLPACQNTSIGMPPRGYQ